MSYSKEIECLCYKTNEECTVIVNCIPQQFIGNANTLDVYDTIISCESSSDVDELCLKCNIYK